MTQLISPYELTTHRKYKLTVPGWFQEREDYIEEGFCIDIDPMSLPKLDKELCELNQPDDGTELRHGDLFADADNDYRGDHTIMWNAKTQKFVILYQYAPTEDPDMDYDPPHPDFPLVSTTDGNVRSIQDSGYIGHYGHTYMNLGILPIRKGVWNKVKIGDYSLHLYVGNERTAPLWEYIACRNDIEDEHERSSSRSYYHITI